MLHNYESLLRTPRSLLQPTHKKKKNKITYISATRGLRGYCTFVHLSKATVKLGALQNTKDCKDFQIEKNANTN